MWVQWLPGNLGFENWDQALPKVVFVSGGDGGASPLLKKFLLLRCVKHAFQLQVHACYTQTTDSLGLAALHAEGTCLLDVGFEAAVLKRS